MGGLIGSTCARSLSPLGHGGHLLGGSIVPKVLVEGEHEGLLGAFHLRWPLGVNLWIKLLLCVEMEH